MKSESLKDMTEYTSACSMEPSSKAGFITLREVCTGTTISCNVSSTCISLGNAEIKTPNGISEYSQTMTFPSWVTSNAYRPNQKELEKKKKMPIM